jgi:hypothetical protein
LTRWHVHAVIAIDLARVDGPVFDPDGVITRGLAGEVRSVA